MPSLKENLWNTNCMKNCYEHFIFSFYLLLHLASSSCIVSEYGTKTKNALVKGSSHVGERVKACINRLKVLLDLRTKKSFVKPMVISKSKFGALADGTKVSKYTLTNANGMKVGILDYGGTVKEIFAPDRNGKLANVSLGFSTIEEYVEKVPILDALPEICQPYWSWKIYIGRRRIHSCH